MKKLLVLIAAVFAFANSFAVSLPGHETPSPIRAADVMIPVGKEGKKISLLDLSLISKRELEKFTGRKMSLMEALAFKGARLKLHKSINRDGYITDKKVQKLFYEDGRKGFHLGGFALGFFLSLLGVLIAYLLDDENNHRRRIWAWIGFGAGLITFLVLFAAAFNGAFL